MCKYMHMQRNELITAKQAGEILGIATRTVHQRIEYGRLYPAMKLDGPRGAYLFDRAYVESIAAKERAATDGTRALAACPQEVA